MPVVKVRAIQRGYYGTPSKLIKNATGVEPGTEIIRNEGEVFLMDVRAMKPPGAPGTANHPTITVGNKTYVLPMWVEDAEHSDSPITAADEVPKGHKTTHRNEPDGSVI